jgi:hypothetical protein
VITETERRRDRPIMSKMRLYERAGVSLRRPVPDAKRIHGVSLETFDQLGGAYPERDALKLPDSH